MILKLSSLIAFTCFVGMGLSVIMFQHDYLQSEFLIDVFGFLGLVSCTVAISSNLIE